MGNNGNNRDRVYSSCYECVVFAPMGLPTLTGPFCIGTWMFLLPAYKFFLPEKQAS